MAKQTINIGASPNDGTGTPLRTAFDYTNQNFTELYTATGPSGNNIVVPGNATITGDLTVDTNTLYVNSSLNRVGIGTASPATILDIQSAGSVFARIQNTASSADAYLLVKNTVGEGFFGINATGPYIYTAGSLPITFTTATSERYRIAADGVATWSNVGGVAGTAMTLNSTGLGVGASPGLTGGTRRALTVNAPTGQLSILELGINGSIAGYLFSNATQTTLAAVGSTFFSVETNAAERLRVDASGNLLVGTTSVINSARVSLKAASVNTVLSLSGVTGDTAQESFVINKFDSNSTTSQVFARFTNGNGAAGSGQINGNGANACAFGSFSDARLKENIVSLPSQLANILSLRPVEFDYKDGSGHQIGFVAQEIQEVYADTVAEQNGFLTVTGWSKTEARLVSAIKELAAKVQALEAKLA